MKTHLNDTITTLLIAASLSVCVSAPAYAQLEEVSPPDPVEITATDFAFRAPKAIPSGWTTIQFTNDGEEAHFVLMSRLPEGKTIDDYEMLGQESSRIWDAIRTGEADQEKAFQMFGEVLPDWFAQLKFAGGPGLVAPGLTSEVTLNLEPGNYVLECYVKTEDGKIHYMEGMLRPITVTEEDSGGSTPQEDVRITLRNFEIDLDGDLTKGMRTFAVHLEENPEEGFGHNVHLARVEDDTTLDDVVSWMNWFDVNGLRSPAPATFIGGMQLMSVGNTAYFTADLKPGRYALISEYTAPMGVVREFTVAP